MTLFCLAAVAGPAGADEPQVSGDDRWRVLGGDAHRLLHDDLIVQMRAQDAARREAAARALESTELLAERQRILRAALARFVGPLPERTPLAPRVYGAIECDGYRIERVVYESRPRHHVTANLYVPTTGQGPYPGVLVPCGHSDNGKAAEAYQSACALLARNGFVALIYDPIGQGERFQLPELRNHGTHEHTLVGAGALLVGLNTASFRCWDGLRSMDYLASRPEVDGHRLGCTGNSGGGTMTTWLMALDDRIVAAAPSCFITSLDRLFTTIGPQDCEQHFPDQGPLGVDHADFIAMRAPRPTLVLAAERDFFDIAGTRTAFAEARRTYAAWGQADRVDLFTYDDEHGFSQPRREAAVAWMRRWLCDDSSPVREPALKMHSNAELQVTASGQVLCEFADEITVVDATLARAAELAPNRARFRDALSARERRDVIRRVLRFPDAPPVVEVEALDAAATSSSSSSSGAGAMAVERLVLRRAGELPIAALVFRSAGAAAEARLPGVIYLHDRGKAADAVPGGAIERLVCEGRVVLAIDAAGWGETADRGSRGKYSNDEFRTAMLSLHVGRPLMGRRTADALAAVEALMRRDDVDSERIELVAIGAAGPIALHAAALDDRIDSVQIDSRIHSWIDDVAARPLDPGQLVHAVPGALAHYDLADLANVLGARVAGTNAEQR